MKKKLLCLVLTALIGVSLFGCGPSTSAKKSENSQPTTSKESTAEVSKEATNPDDPLDLFKVSEDFAKENGGIYLYRDKTLYSLNVFASLEKAEAYGVGYRWNETNRADLYRYRDMEQLSYLSMGDVPLVVLHRSDEIRGYGDNNHYLEVDIAGFEGNAPAVLGGGEDLYIYTDLSEEPIQADLKSAQLTDENGNSVSMRDIYSLDYEASYKITWTESKKQYDTDVVANCNTYSMASGIYLADGVDYNHVIEGQPTQDGYVTFDLSEVEPETYLIKNNYGGVFSIQ